MFKLVRGEFMAKKKMSIGILGLGKYGMALAEALVSNGKEVACLDRDENKVKKALEYTDFAYVTEELSTANLLEMGFDQCETIVICIGEHMDSAIFATINALALKNVKVITMSNTDEMGRVLEKLGAEVVYPYKDSVEKLAKKLSSTNVLDFIALSDNIEICEVKIPKAYLNKAIRDTDIRLKYGLNIIAIRHDAENIELRIDPEYVLKDSDTLIVLGESKFLRKFESRQ